MSAAAARHAAVCQQSGRLPAAAGWLTDHGARTAVIGSRPGQLRPRAGRRTGRGRSRGAPRSAMAHASRTSPPRSGKTDPGDALAIADVVRRKRGELGPALEPELVRRSRCSTAAAPVRPRPHPGDPAAARRLDPTGSGQRGQGRPARSPTRVAASVADLVRWQPGRADRRSLHPRTRARHRGPQRPDHRGRCRDRSAAGRARQPSRRPARRRQPDRGHADRPSRRRSPLQEARPRSRASAPRSRREDSSRRRSRFVGRGPPRAPLAPASRRSAAIRSRSSRLSSVSS